MQDAVEDRLDATRFPFLGGGGQRGQVMRAPQVTRYGQWGRGGAGGQVPIRTGPRLLIFVVGGVSYSEMRCAYEVSKQYPAWEVVVGGTHLLTPETFLKDLKELSAPSSLPAQAAQAPAQAGDTATTSA